LLDLFEFAILAVDLQNFIVFLKAKVNFVSIFVLQIFKNLLSLSHFVQKSKLVALKFDELGGVEGRQDPLGIDEVFLA
jgi:hypothetical protein